VGEGKREAMSDLKIPPIPPNHPRFSLPGVQFYSPDPYLPYDHFRGVWSDIRFLVKQACSSEPGMTRQILHDACATAAHYWHMQGHKQLERFGGDGGKGYYETATQWEEFYRAATGKALHEGDKP